MTAAEPFVVGEGLRVWPEMEQRSEPWYAARRGIVTASSVGTLLSVGIKGAGEFECPGCGALPKAPCVSKRGSGEPTPIKTMHPERTTVATEKAIATIEPISNDKANALTASLVAERITNYTEPSYVNADMQRGIEDEPDAVAKYAETHWVSVTECGFMVRQGEGWTLGYSPDALVGDDGLLEVKSRRQKKQVTTVLSGEVPPENMAQCQAGLLVSGREWIDFVSWSGGMHMWTVRVFPDPMWFDAIIAACKAFETTAGEMTDAYLAAVEGLPLTERRPESQEMF